MRHFKLMHQLDTFSKEKPTTSMDKFIYLRQKLKIKDYLKCVYSLGNGLANFK